MIEIGQALILLLGWRWQGLIMHGVCRCCSGRTAVAHYKAGHLKPASMPVIVAKCQLCFEVPMVVVKAGGSARPCFLCENAGRFK